MTKEEEEKISTVIIDDNRNLILKLNKAECQIQQLMKELEKLKEKPVRNKKSSQENRTCSIGSLTVASNVQDLFDTSNTSDTERFRKSFNQSKRDEHFPFSPESSFILNTSDNHIQTEQSVNFKLEASPPSEKSTEAVLWKIYETQKSETESFYDISINHDTVISDSSNPNKVNGLHRNNIKVGNVGADSLLNQENKCVLQILNVDPNLNRIKEITKNGSYEKLYQVLKRWGQERVNGTNNCNQLDLQEMLKVLTECLYIAMQSVNTVNPQDKCCSTNEDELCSVIELNVELNKLKIKLNTTVQEYNIHVQECRKEKDELKEENMMLKNKYQISEHECEEQKKKNKERSIVIEQLKKRQFDTKKSYEKILQREKMENENLKNIISGSEKKKYLYESLCKLTKRENNKLKQEIIFLKERIKKLEHQYNYLQEKNEKILNEKETQLIESTAYKKQLESQVAPNYFKKNDNISRLTQESVNESICSGAFQKSFSHYVSENEDDFTSSKPIIKENERIQEIRRRNSLYPKQLQSSYPLEADLNATYNSLYVLANEETKEPFNCKKRKLADVEGEMPSPFQCNLEPVKTPVRKDKKKFVTPPSLRKLLNSKSKH